MDELLSTTIAAYGGLDRWRNLKQVSCSVLVGGRLCGIKRVEMPSSPLRATCRLHVQQTEIVPFGDPNWKMTFTPNRVVIESDVGELIADRDNPKVACTSHVHDTPWDPLHLAFFTGYTIWTDLASPWIFSEPDFDTWEIEPMSENGEIWRSLRVRFPDRFATHHKEQTFRIGPDGLVRRYDYEIDVWAGARVAHYVYDHVELQGLKFPARHRVYSRSEENTPDKNFVAISADLSDWGLS
jgi:hypothetical protein